MTRLLVSARDAAEARVAVEAGAGFVDFKDPEAGALGVLPLDTLRAGLTAVAGASPTSATAGDLQPDPDIVGAAVANLAGTDVDHVKVGLWPGERRREVVLRLGREFSARTRLVGVLLADADPDQDLLPLMAEAGFVGAMIDVAGKGSRLTALMDRRHLISFVTTCRAHDLMAGFAGSLRISDIPWLASLGPDVLGFRGGLCRGFDRTAPLEPSLVAEAVRTLAAATA